MCLNNTENKKMAPCDLHKTVYKTIIHQKYKDKLSLSARAIIKTLVPLYPDVLSTTKHTYIQNLTK